MEKNKRNKKHIYKVGEVVNNELEIIKKSRNKFNHKSYVVKSLIYPDAPYYNIDESSIKKGTDCSKSSFEYIRNSINNCSYLPNIKKEEESKIINDINHNKNLPMRQIINLYINEEKSSYEIASILNVHQSTIIRALSKNNIEIRDGHKITSKKVICTTTGELFKSISEAQRYYGINNVSNVCNGNRKSAGVLNGKPLKWEFVEE